MARVFVNDSTLADIADAIREKNGSTDTYKPSEMGNAVRAIESGGNINPMYHFSQFFFIENEEEWEVGEFTLLSDVSTGYLSVVNPAGKIPKDILVISKDIQSLNKKLNETQKDVILVGGCNSGNIDSDSGANRTLVLQPIKDDVNLEYFFAFVIKKSLWNLINSSCPSVGTSEMLYFRANGGNNATTWTAGEYYVAVRA